MRVSRLVLERAHRQITVAHHKAASCPRAMTLPGVIADPEETLRSLQLFRKLQQEGSTIMYGHDLDFWSNVTQAPARLG